MREDGVLSLQTSELGVTEHVEGDPCKFALWVGRTPTSDNRIVLKVKTRVTYFLFYCWTIVVLRKKHLD